jgi:folate-binding protein YgfZ
MSFDRPHLAPVNPELAWFTGPDSIRFINDLISQEIGTAEPGDVKRSLLLTPQGKLDHIFWVLRGSEEVGLVVEDGRGEGLVATLSRYRIRVKVEIEPYPVTAWLVVGPFEHETGRWTGNRSELTADLSWPTVERSLVVGERPDLPLLDAGEYELLRIEAGEPLMDVDVTDSTIPQETGLVAGSISFDKGCFLGQELVARLDSRGGRVNHHLRILRFEGGTPSVGNEIVTEGEPVGVLTSAAHGVGLSRLRRGVEPGDVVTVDEARAVVEAIPGVDPSGDQEGSGPTV